MMEEIINNYNEIHETAYKIGKQNFLLFQYIIDRGLIKDWNNYHSQHQKEVNS